MNQEKQIGKWNNRGKEMPVAGFIMCSGNKMKL